MLPEPTTPAPILNPPANALLHRCETASVGVLQADGELRLVATRLIPAGERIFQIEGHMTDRATRYSVQVDEQVHLDVNGATRAEIIRRYFWQFMNHGCEPNAAFQGRAIVARRDIQAGEAVVFNYNTTEWEMAEPFACRCGSAGCLNEIRGFKYLAPEQRAKLRDVAPHLIRLMQRTGHTTS